MLGIPNILVLCTGNSCRSQMAEGYLRHYASDQFNIYSAGTIPKPEVHPMAVSVMQEDGIDISGQYPKDLKEYLGRLGARYLLIVCSDADKSCPRIWPGMMNRIVWAFDDPAAFQGPPTATLDEFRRIRNEIKNHIQAWLASLP